MANSLDKKLDSLDEEVVANLDMLMQMDVIEEEEAWNIVGDNEFLEAALSEEKKKE